MREPIPNDPVTPGGMMVNLTMQGESTHLRCRRASRMCARSCRFPSKNCTRLNRWVELHGPLPVWENPEEYYFHLSGEKA